MKGQGPKKGSQRNMVIIRVVLAGSYLKSQDSSSIKIRGAVRKSSV